MPIFVHCADLRAGMRLAEPLTVGGRVLFASGRDLSDDDVRSLQRRYPRVNLRIGDPVLDSLVDFEDDTHDRTVALTVQQKIGTAMAGVVERCTGRASLVDVGVQAVQACVVEVLEFLKANPVSAALLTRNLDGEAYLAQHAGSVFYLSTLLGSVVREYVAQERQRQSIAGALQPNHVLDLAPLGLGAMFADIGMASLQHLLTEDRPLTPEERQAVHAHPLAGANLLPGNFSPLARMIVRTHHENYDGSGYPGRLARDKLHVFSRLVRIADAFDAATAGSVFGETKSPVRVLWEMSQGPYRRFYDPTLMKVFSNLIQPFPIGAKLTLLDGRIAVVVRYNRNNAFEPYVVVAFNAEGERLPDAQLCSPVRLNENHDLRAARFGSEDLAYLYQHCTEDAPPPAADWTTVLAATFP